MIKKMSRLHRQHFPHSHSSSRSFLLRSINLNTSLKEVYTDCMRHWASCNTIHSYLHPQDSQTIFNRTMSTRQMCGVKKGRVFIGSQSSHQAAHHSAVRSQRSPQSGHRQRQTHTHTQSQVKGEGWRSFTHQPLHLQMLGRRFLLKSLVNSEWCLSCDTGGTDSHWFSTKPVV